MIQCPTILEEFSKHIQVLIITTKNKLYNLLSKGLNMKNSLVLSVEELSSNNFLLNSYINLEKFGFSYIFI